MFEATIPVGDPAALVSLFGVRDEYLRTIRETLGVAITTRDGQIHVEGDETEVAQATEVLERLKAMLGREGRLGADQVAQILLGVTGGPEPPEIRPVEVHVSGRSVRPRTAGQGRYVEAIRQHDLVFCIGPAGTGKTYLAVATAVEALRQKQVRKIVLVRPAVEAGESLGFLPGDLQAKINPYLRPLMDALGEMMDYDQVKRDMEEDTIEVIPLAYMRGRTLNGAFIILDEAQNTTVPQMKMFLTRMGEGAKMVVSGDTTQVDLPRGTRSGLVDAIGRLRNIHGVCRITLSAADIVRHRMVERIVAAYDQRSKKSR